MTIARVLATVPLEDLLIKVPVEALVPVADNKKGR